MFERFGRDVRKVVMVTAIREAERRGDSRIGTEHLLIAAAEAPGAHGAAFFSDIGASAAALRRTLDELDEESLARIGVIADADALGGEHGTEPDASLPWLRRRVQHRPFTAGAKAALQRTLDEAIDLDHRHIGAEHLVLGLTSGPPQDLATMLLRRLGLEPAAIHATLRLRLRVSA